MRVSSSTLGAASAARCESFQSPHRYDTEVNQLGTNLSYGELGIGALGDLCQWRSSASTTARHD